MRADLETVLLALHALAPSAREAGICITWYEPRELSGLHPDLIEDVMMAAANEFIDFNAPFCERQLPLDMDVPESN